VAPRITDRSRFKRNCGQENMGELQLWRLTTESSLWCVAKECFGERFSDPTILSRSSHSSSQQLTAQNIELL